jgi:hypothetical protein
LTATDITVLDQIISEGRKQYAPDMDADDYFELFASQQVLRDRKLDLQEIQSGIIGGDKSGSDGGIDAFYILVNGRPIEDIDSAESLGSLLKQHVLLEVIFTQATLHQGFELAKVVRLKDTVEEVLALGKEPAEFSEQYSQSLLERIEIFRTVHKVLAPKFPTFHVQYVFVTKGDTTNIAHNVDRTAKDFELSSRSLLATIKKCECKFVGARELITLSAKPPKTSFTLKCVDSTSSGKDAYVAIVKLTEFFEFIKDENGELRTHLFESNVRDYQGDVSVNEAIRSTLEKPESPQQFWWLNNGVTILAEQVGGHPKELNVEDPQIVNGLQTSEEIFKYFTSFPSAANSDNRELLVKVIGSTEIEVQDRIIRATNSQTSIPPASLWPQNRDSPRY